MTFSSQCFQEPVQHQQSEGPCWAPQFHQPSGPALPWSSWFKLSGYKLGFEHKVRYSLDALRESCLKHMQETYSSVYIYIYKDTAAEASLLKIPSCLSMMDESLIFLIPIPQNTKPSVSGTEITNRATQRSPNQAKHFPLTYKIPCCKTH